MGPNAAVGGAPPRSPRLKALAAPGRDDGAGAKGAGALAARRPGPGLGRYAAGLALALVTAGSVVTADE